MPAKAVFQGAERIRTAVCGFSDSYNESTRCDICHRVIGKDEPLYYECPDGLPGHDWLECEDCHRKNRSLRLETV